MKLTWSESYLIIALRVLMPFFRKHSRWYAGSRYIKQTEGSTTTEFTWIGGDAYSAPVVAEKVGSTTSYYYLLRDYLGNITHKVNTSNAVVAEYSFDAWGRRRDKDDWHYTLTGEPDLTADRGFTAHEYLPWFNIVNMNGRLYDPVVGRFLSPDNYVQNPLNTQNYNRYSYCLNNPLIYTDPTGEKWKWPKFTWFNAIPIIGQLDYIMGMINDNTTELRQKMVDANIPSFGAGYNTAHGSFHYVGNSGNMYHRLPGQIAAGQQRISNEIAQVRQEHGAAWRAASSDGIWTIGYTGTVSPVYGFSFEIGIAIDPKNDFEIGLYFTLEETFGVDLSQGAIINYHTPREGREISISNLNGWGESTNYAFLFGDWTYGGNALKPGLHPKNLADFHSHYYTYGLGVSVGSPIGFTINKGFTWTNKKRLKLWKK